MMNEYPHDLIKVYHEIRDSDSVGFVASNYTEYLELIEAMSVATEKYLTCQAIQQHKIWHLVNPNATTPTVVENLFKN
jgi:hypothetical protein